MRPALVLALGLAGCALFGTTAKPAAYGAELTACEEASHSWAEFTPCCESVARKYGRDPSFCQRPADAGAE